MQLPIFLDRGSRVPLQRQMYDAIRQMVLTGKLRHDSTVIEDGYDSEYRYHRAPLPASTVPPAMCRFRVHRYVLQSDVVPGHSLGYVITSATLAHRFAAAKLMMDRHTSLLEQMALVDLIEAGPRAKAAKR